MKPRDYKSIPLPQIGEAMQKKSQIKNPRLMNKKNPLLQLEEAMRERINLKYPRLTKKQIPLPQLKRRKNKKRVVQTRELSRSPSRKG